MEIIRTCSRRELFTFYLSREREKGNIISINDIDCNDPHAIDRFFRASRLKEGVIPGYKQWKYVRLFKEDFLQCAIVNHIFQGQRLLSALCTTKEFHEWKPHKQTAWFDYIEQMTDIAAYPEKWALIIRPALPTEEGARWYVEDGSGRSICFLRRLLRLGKDGFAYAYIGMEPDEKSEWIHTKMPELLHRHDMEMS